MGPHYPHSYGVALRVMRVPMEWDGGHSETHDMEQDGTMTEGARGAPSSPPTHLWGSMQEPQ